MRSRGSTILTAGKASTACVVTALLCVSALAADSPPTRAAEALNVFSEFDSLPVLLRLETAFADGNRGPTTPLGKAGILPGDELKLIAGDTGAGFQTGFAVAIDGRRALVGSMGHDVNGPYSGAAYVFEHNGVAWVEMDRLVPADGAAYDFFGWSVAISGDRALVGAFADDGERGAAYVFAFDGSSWSQEAKLRPTDSTAGQDFGVSVALQNDRAAIGAFGDTTVGSPYGGAAYVFERSGGAWSQTAKLLATDGAARDNAGVSIALDADRIVVGADGHDGAGSSAGAAYVFAYDGSSWSQEAQLLASDGSEQDFFGGAVSIRGNLIAAGASIEATMAPSAGAVYVFRWNAIAWNEEAKLMAADAAAYDYFGTSVSLGYDFVLVGSYGVDEMAGGAGASYLFGRTDTGWFENAKYLASDGAADDAYGTAVATDGASLIVGSPGNATGAGAAYAFSAASDFHRFVLLADRSLELDRQGDFAGDIHSNGWIDLQDGDPSTLNGNVTAVGDVSIARRQTINGDVTAGGIVTISPQATVTGTVTAGAPVGPLPLPSFGFTAGGSNIRARPRRLLSVPPGTYGSVVMQANSVLVLAHDGTTGDYYFESLVAQNRAVLLVSVQRGPVNIHVVGDVDFRSRSSVLNWPFGDAGATRTVFNILGDVAMGSDTSIRGLFNAPYGHAYMAGGAGLLGVICADTIRVDRGAAPTLPPVARDRTSTSTGNRVAGAR